MDHCIDTEEVRETRASCRSLSSPASHRGIGPRNLRQWVGAAAVLVLAILALLAAMLVVTPNVRAYDQEAINFLNIINSYRADYGLPPLGYSAELTNAAVGHSEDMATNNFFSHIGSDGSTPWQRIYAAGYTYNTDLAENIAAGFSDSWSVFLAWANSPEHNANMLDPNLHAIGIGRAYNSASTYGWYWTTDFGGVYQDNLPPTVSVPQPTGSSIVSGTVPFAGSATDESGVRDIELYIDGNLVATVPGGNYTYYWNTKLLPNGGQHTLLVTAHDNYGNLGQASTTVTIDNFTPAERYLFTWYDQRSPGLTDWVLMANPAVNTSAARASALVGATTYADRDMNPGASPETPTFPGVIGGPVTVDTTEPLIASQRVLFNDSFNEVPAIRADRLASTYYFTWYDSKPSDGMNGDWILVSNQGGLAASVDIYIAGTKMGSYTINPGDRVTPLYPGIANGPVKVICTNGQPLVVSQRVIYDSAFSEVLGVPEAKLTSDYYFPWYDFKSTGMNGNWILIGNQDIGDATVDVYIGNNSQPIGTYTIPQGGRVTPIYPGVIGGPVHVVSTNGKKLIVSQRVLYQQSFEEVQGMTTSDAHLDQWFTWYDSLASDSMAGNWVMVTNSGSSDASVGIYVGGTLMQQSIVKAGTSAPYLFPNTVGGPVRVVSTNGQPVLVTQRVLYKSSFNEVAGMIL